MSEALNVRIRRSLQRRLNRHGLAVVPYPVPESLPWLLRHVLRLHPVAQVVDVGAHYGQTVRLLRRDAGYAGPIVSFEPYAPAFARLSRYASSDPQWTGHRVALGRSSGVLRLNTFARSSLNSALAPTAFALDSLPILHETRPEEVPLARLDSFALADGPLLLKSDTQGYDTEVLAGAAGVWPRVVAVVVELSALPLYDGMPAMREMMDRLAADGFQVAGLAPVSRAGTLGVIEFDGVFVRAGT